MSESLNVKRFASGMGKAGQFDTDDGFIDAGKLASIVVNHQMATPPRNRRAWAPL
ncbi:MAG: hypothetical protein KAI77_00315 [Gammaproteobacteria bacterium]|nr:hypothetical protein [Gammaproteobacteria bacterium]